MGNEENINPQLNTHLQVTDKNESSEDKKTKFKVNTNKLIEQRPRSTGFKSFLNWFKKVESLQRVASEESSSASESSDDDSSASSTATVASFSFLPANIYKPYGDASQPEKFIASGPYTETYHKLILERNRRRNMDKNLSLRKKYSLYRSGTLSEKVNSTPLMGKKVTKDENVTPIKAYDTFSLPLIIKNDSNKTDSYKKNRRTASLSSKDKNSGTLCHVKGKRKAPLPPVNPEFTKSYRKKRQAPPPPPDAVSKLNDNKLENIPIIDNTIVKNNTKLAVDVSHPNPSTELSPKPWYKRQVSDSKTKKNKTDSSKKKNKNEYPEVGFFRYSRIFENKKGNHSEKSELDIKQEKRSSCLLPNISELDREAAEIIKQHKQSMLNQEEEYPPCNKPSSARELISKFNALTKAAKEPQSTAKSTDHNKGLSTRSPISLLIRKNFNNYNECNRSDLLIKTPEFKKKVLEKNNDPKISPIAGRLAKSVTNIKKCVNCDLENTTSGDICIGCINIQLTLTSKPSVDDTESAKERKRKEESSQSFQAEVFSAIPSLNYIPDNGSNFTPNVKANVENSAHPKISDAEEKLKLREILKEMKNSLPKRPKPQKLLNASINISSEKITPDIIEKPLLNSELPTKSLNEISNSSDDNKIKDKNEIMPKDMIQNNKSSDENCTVQPVIGNIKLIGKDTYLEVNLSNEKTKIQLERPREFISNKVSSSAQTSCIIRKNDAPLNMDKKETEKSKLDSKVLQVQAPNALYANTQEVQISQPSTSQEDLKNENTRILLKKLESAIAEGNDLLAASLAKDLALQRVNCSVTSISPRNVDTNKRIQIYIEDQISHQGPIPIRVNEEITISQLKLQIDKELHIPTAVQRWIIGKQLTTDDSVALAHYNGNDFDIPLFLYVVAPEKKQDDNKKCTEDSKNIAKPSTSKEENISNVTENTPKFTSTNVININKPRESFSQLIVKDVVLKEPTKNPQISKVVSMKDVKKKTWICSGCTLINSLLSPLCSACGGRKVETTQPEQVPKPTEDANHYLQLMTLDETDLVPNTDKFECPICLMDCEQKAGVVLRECLHSFCKDCLANTVKFSEEAEIKCPYRDRNYSCDSVIQEREIKALVDKKMFEKHLAKSVSLAENKIQNTFHCKSADCKGWCIIEENINDFHCPVCKKVNCLTCQAIHERKNCKEYQDQISMDDASSSDGQRTKQMLEEMVSKGEAMVCPSCQVILMKKWGCDWLRCSMCKTEICWVTRGPRWGPAGKGDLSGGCQCGQHGVKCHPKCNYCH